MAILLALLTGCSRQVAPEIPEAALLVELFALNVGKADAILITVGEQRFLVDTGTKAGYDELEEKLRKLEVTHLDCVFLTHTDKDNGGGMKKLSESDIEVDRWYAASIYYEKDADDHQAVKAASERGAEVTWLSAGDLVELGGGCRFEVLAPLVVDTACENNNSLVLRLITPEGNALLAGDMEKEGEQRLLASGADLSAVYLKVAHHGRDDATGAAFAAAVSPRAAVISTYTPDQPDSPAASVVKTLQAAGASVYVTQDDSMGIRIALRGGYAVLLDSEK